MSKSTVVLGGQTPKIINIGKLKYSNSNKENEMEIIKNSVKYFIYGAASAIGALVGDSGSRYVKNLINGKSESKVNSDDSEGDNDHPFSTQTS